ncbi:MAG: DUF6804 family protein [Acidaminococcaceae bacterium]
MLEQFLEKLDRVVSKIFKENLFTAKLVAMCLLISDYLDSNESYNYDFGSGFFTIIKIVVFIFSLLALYDYHKKKRAFGVWVFGLIAVLYNPICGVEFVESRWVLVDMLAAVVFGISLLLEYRNESREK